MTSEISMIPSLVEGCFLRLLGNSLVSRPGELLRVISEVATMVVGVNMQD
jgi:hypothetical protein